MVRAAAAAAPAVVGESSISPMLAGFMVGSLQLGRTDNQPMPMRDGWQC